MKTKYFLPAALLAAAFAGSAALAQDNSPAPSATVQAAPTPVNGVVFVAKLPTATQLTKDAEEEGLSIVRIDQSADRVLVVYKYPNGTTRTFAYTTSENGTPAVTQAPQATSTATYTMVSAAPQAQGNVVYATTPAPTVVYTSPAPVYYTTAYSPYYDPAWDFWAPLAIGVGLGWGFHGGGYYHGGYHGGWHGGGHGWHH